VLGSFSFLRRARPAFRRSATFEERRPSWREAREEY
jgi:hypothetical protein